MGRIVTLISALLALVVLLASCCCCCSGMAPSLPVVPTHAPIHTPRPAPTPFPTPTPYQGEGGIPLPGPISVGETVRGELADLAATDVWLLIAPDPAVVTIDLIAVDNAWDPVLEVWATEGEMIARDDDSGQGFNPRVSQLSLLPGSYELRVRAFSGNGGYTLSVAAAEAPQEQSIGYGETARGEITARTPEGWWLFEGQAGDIVNISMVGLGDFRDTYLELYGPDEMWLTSDDDSGEGLFALISGYFLPQTGTYRIVARPYGNQVGSYELSLERLEVEEQSITYGETRSGELGADVPREYWLFEGTSGDIVSISMVGLEDFHDTYLELYGPDGALLTSNDDGGEGLFALIGNYVLPQSGTYRIVARPYGERGGAYELTLIRVKEQTIAYGQTLPGELTATEPQAHWLFAGEAGDLVSISMVGLGELDDTYLELYDLDGLLLATDDDSGKGLFARIDGYTLPVTGTYRIVASAFGGEYDIPYGREYDMPLGVQPGSYRLTLQRVEERTIAYGETLAGELMEEEMRGYWLFAGEAGDVVGISMEGVGDFEDTYLELRGPDDTLLTEDDDSGEGYFALIDDYILPQSGDYRIVARAFADQGGAYRLTLLQVAIREQVITYTETLSGELTLEDPLEYWRFDGEAGDVIGISMVGLAGFEDTYLELYGPDGVLLTSDDDSGADRFALIDGYELPASGTYRIVARAWGGDMGPYELTLTGH